jgi:UDP-3-O-[3-hydroxymyristoyl] glucosamine N-acyltransferase
MGVRIAALAAELGATIHGDGDREIDGVAPLDVAGPGEISFFSNRKYKGQYLATRAGAVIIEPSDLALGRPEGATILAVEQAYLAFAKVSTRFHRPPAHAPGIDPRAHVDPTAEVDPTATVLPFAYVGRRAKIGAHTVIHAGCAILDDAVIGPHSLLYPGVVVREACRLGAHAIVQPGAIIGGDGFGFAFDREHLRHFKVPQAGTVVIGDDVEIGANTCVDRGTLGDTKVGSGAKIDNLCQIAHNVEVGPLSLLAGCTAIAGSTKVGTGVVMGGQVGLVGHLTIGDGAKFAAKSGVHADVEPGATMAGWPAIDSSAWMKEQAALHRLPDLLKQVRMLEKRVAELEEATRG